MFSLFPQALIATAQCNLPSAVLRLLIATQCLIRSKQPWFFTSKFAEKRVVLDLRDSRKLWKKYLIKLCCRNIPCTYCSGLRWKLQPSCVFRLINVLFCLIFVHKMSESCWNHSLKHIWVTESQTAIRLLTHLKEKLLSSKKEEDRDSTARTSFSLPCGWCSGHA